MLDIIYGLAVNLRNAAYNRNILRSEQASVPVVSVGNIQVGGTGKTPLAAWMLDLYQKEGVRAAYLSRGYGRESRGFRRVERDGAWQEFGDEAILIANRFPKLPVAVCEDRVEGAAMLVDAYNADIIVLDDAFQHRRLQRDFNLVTIDVSRSWLKEKLLPFGRLREPWKGLYRADFVIASKVSSKNQIPQIETDLKRWEKPLACCFPRLSQPVWKGSPPNNYSNKVVLFSGLGNNEMFAKNVAQSQMEVLNHLTFTDHHPYSTKDLETIVQSWDEAVNNCPPNDLPVLLTTEKDYFRIRNSLKPQQWDHIPWGYLPMEINWLTGENALKDQLLRVLGNV